MKAGPRPTTTARVGATTERLKRFCCARVVQNVRYRTVLNDLGKALLLCTCGTKRWVQHSTECWVPRGIQYKKGISREKTNKASTRVMRKSADLNVTRVRMRTQK